MRKTLPWLVSATLGATIASTMTWYVVNSPGTQSREPGLNQLMSEPKSFASAIKKAAPVVVNFYTTQASKDDSTIDELPGSSGLKQSNKKIQTSSLGSGVIMDKSGLLMTNNHVIQNAVQIRALLHDGRDLPAEVIGHDPDTDLALLKIEANNLPEAIIANENEVQTGDIVLAIGHPYGLGQAVSMGIVSAVQRNGLNLSTFEDFIQTDAAINRGSSGGALVNTEGQIIGISTAILTESGGSQGIGFAIPAHLAINIMEALLEDGRVRRGWLGILPEPIDPATASALNLPKNTGIKVKAIAPHTPASLAGFEPGDVIVRVGNEVVNSQYEALKAVASQPPGSKVDIHILRAEKPLIIQVEVAERPQNNSK